MFHDATNVKYIDGYRLEVEFDTGEKGIIDLGDLSKEGGIFSRFSDIEYFKQVYINKELCVLTWPGDIDLAPETIYSMATGKPLPEWMEVEDE